MKTTSKLVAVIVTLFCLFFAGGVAFGFLVPSAALKLVDNPNAPAWVQAVGSIIAILIAVWVPNYQHSKQQKVEEDKRRAFMRVFIKRVDYDFDLLENHRDKPELCKKITDLISSDLREFLKTGVDQIRGEACLELLRAFEAMAWEIDFNRPEMENYPVVIEVIRQQFEQLKKVAD